MSIEGPSAHQLALQLGFYAETFDGDFGKCLKDSAAMLNKQSGLLGYCESTIKQLRLDIGECKHALRKARGL